MYHNFKTTFIVLKKIKPVIFDKNVEIIERIFINEAFVSYILVVGSTGFINH